MRDSFDPLALAALSDGLSPDEQAALCDALAANPTLADDTARWARLRAAVGERLHADLPDPSVLVLQALSDAPGMLTDAETARLAEADLPAVLAAHPGAARAVDRLRADRDAFEAAWAAPLPDVAASPEAPARRASRPARVAADRTATRSTSSPSRWVWRVSALAAVAAFAVIALRVGQRDASFATITADTARTVQLPDGSTVDLDAGSVLRIPGAGISARQARLDRGQALFRIVHDPSDPFTVQTPNADVTVLGTTFTVDTKQIGGLAETGVVLVEGAVTLAPRATPDAAVRLAPGQQSRLVNLDAPDAPSRADLAVALAWTGDVSARDETAAAVARRIGERFGVAVTVDPALADEHVSGTFGGPDGARDALTKLALTLGTTVHADTAADGRAAYRLGAR